jgi:hypothetical protein
MDKKGILLFLSPEMVDAIDRSKGLDTRTAYIRSAIKARLEKEE